MAATDPVFILGAPRSGTSLLYKCLCLHPRAAWISNWVARFPFAPELAVLNRLPRRAPALEDAAWFDETGNAYVYGRRRPLRERLVPMPVEGEPVFARGQWERAVARIVRAGGGDVFVSKRIANNRRVPAIVAAFAGARFVHVVRDGRDVARSLATVDWWETSVVDWYGGTPGDWRAEQRDPVELRARTWVEELAAIREGLRSVADDRVMTIRYEDLLAEPAAGIDRLAGFTGLGTHAPWRARVLARLGVRGAAAPRTDGETRRVEAFQRDDLVAYGYTLTQA